MWGTRSNAAGYLAPLPKLNVVGSIPIARSKFSLKLSWLQRPAADLAFPAFPNAFPMLV